MQFKLYQNELWFNILLKLCLKYLHIGNNLYQAILHRNIVDCFIRAIISELLVTRACCIIVYNTEYYLAYVMEFFLSASKFNSVHLWAVFIFSMLLNDLKILYKIGIRSLTRGKRSSLLYFLL